MRDGGLWLPVMLRLSASEKLFPFSATAAQLPFIDGSDVVILPFVLTIRIGLRTMMVVTMMVVLRDVVGLIGSRMHGMILWGHDVFLRAASSVCGRP